MELVIQLLGWFALVSISTFLLAITGKIIFDAATADYKLYKHVRLCRKRLLRQRYEDYAWLLFQLEKDTEVFNLTHNTRDWTFEDWRDFYLKKAKEDKKRERAMNVDKAKRNIRKVYKDIQTESAYGSTVSVSKMNEWAEILDDALAFLGD